MFSRFRNDSNALIRTNSYIKTSIKIAVSHPRSYILFFPSISLHCSLKKGFLFLLVILWSSSFSWIYLALLPFMSLLFSAICKDSSDNHFAFLHFFFLGAILVTISYTLGLIINSNHRLVKWKNMCNINLLSTILCQVV